MRLVAEELGEKNAGSFYCTQIAMIFEWCDEGVGERGVKW